MMTPAEAAYAAAEIMSQRGHCKGVREDDQGRVCYYGALMVAVTGQSEGFFWKNSDVLLAASVVRDIADISSDILCVRDDPDWEPHHFNNREDVTGEDVILLLKETGRRLEETCSSR